MLICRLRSGIIVKIYFLRIENDFLVSFCLALGIRCYDCKIKSPASLCDKTLSNDTNAVNCSGIFDTCVSTALTIKSKIGNLEKSAYMMTCGQKVSIALLNQHDKLTNEHHALCIKACSLLALAG